MPSDVPATALAAPVEATFGQLLDEGLFPLFTNPPFVSARMDKVPKMAGPVRWPVDWDMDSASMEQLRVAEERASFDASFLAISVGDVFAREKVCF